MSASARPLPFALASTSSWLGPSRRPLTRPVSVRALASARKAPVMLAPLSSTRTASRLTLRSFTVTRTSASPPVTRYGLLDSTSILKSLSPRCRPPSSSWPWTAGTALASTAHARTFEIPFMCRSSSFQDVACFCLVDGKHAALHLAVREPFRHWNRLCRSGHAKARASRHEAVQLRLGVLAEVQTLRDQIIDRVHDLAVVDLESRITLLH